MMIPSGSSFCAFAIVIGRKSGVAYSRDGASSELDTKASSDAAPFELTLCGSPGPEN